MNTIVMSGNEILFGNINKCIIFIMMCSVRATDYECGDEIRPWFFLRHSL